MKTTPWLAGIAALLITAAAHAQDGDRGLPSPFAYQPAPAFPTLATGMSDEQMRKALVHAKAAEKAAQRRDRMASLQWMGYSPSRPPASSCAWMGTYSFTPRVVVYPWGGAFVVRSNPAYDPPR